MIEEKQVSDMTDDELRAAEQSERGVDEQQKADNTVNRPRLTRHQLVAAVRKENPDIKYNSDLFREACVVQALEQEGTNLRRLADFLGMSKGEVRNHIIKFERKLQAARNNLRERVESATEKAIREYEATTKETVEAANAEREDVGSTAENNLSKDVDHGDLPPLGT